MVLSQVYLSVVLLSLLSVFTTAAGVALAIRFAERDWAIALGIGFSAGIMLLISFLELIPEAAETASLPAVLAAVLLGGVLLFSLHLIVPHVHLVDEAGERGAQMLKSAYLVVLGLVLHDLPEGFAMANSFVSAPSLGVLVAVAIALHNLPEEFAMAVPAVLTKRKRFLYGSAILSALAEPVGAIIGLIAVDLVPALNAMFMAFAAGAMIFVSVHELIPMARRYGKLPLFAIGAGLSVVVYLVLRLLI